MTYRLSRQAEQDLIDIYVASVAAFGPAQAERYQDMLEEAFDLIAQFPLIARDRAEMTPPVRIHPVKSHIIVYLIDNSAPLVLRVRHGAEDWRNGE